MIGPIIRTRLLENQVFIDLGVDVSPVRADIMVKTPYVAYQLEHDFNYGKETGKSIVTEVMITIMSERYLEADSLMMATESALDKYSTTSGNIVLDSIDIQDAKDGESTSSDVFVRHVNLTAIWHVED